MGSHHGAHFKHHFGAHKFHHENSGGNFEQDIKFEELFDSPFLNFHDFEDIGDFRVHPKGSKRRTKNKRRAASGQQSCRTVTQQVGNTVTTFTQCS